MSGVKRSAYRQPVTPSGLEAIEKGTLSWLDEDMYNNLNTGVLEQYLEEKNLNESFEVSHWDSKKVLIGILIGAVFSGVTAYIGLKIGLAVSAAWYVAYLTGMALQWSPSEVNISTSATTGATHASTGFIFTFPAIFLLAYSEDYKLGDVFLITSVDTFQIAFIGIIASMFAGFLGVMYFIIFRRVWLVEDPLPMPGFEATLKMLDISSDVSTGAADAARESLKTVGIWTVFTMVFMFIIDYPIKWSNKVANIPSSLADWLAMTLSGDDWGAASIYTERWLHQPSQLSDGHAIANGITLYEPGNPFSYTFLGIELSPTLLAIGWFMKFRVALLVSLGTFFTWFIVTPLAYHYDYPFYLPLDGNFHSISQFSPTGSLVSYGYVARPMAIGAILGGGITGLLKMAPVFKTTAADVIDIFKGEGDNASRKDYVEGKGWYEWPISHIPVLLIVSLIGITLAFSTQFGFFASLIFSLVLCLTTFALGAIAVKVMGETSIEPVSGTSFIVLLMLVLIFKVLGLSESDTAVLALVGTTVFGGAISMSGTVIGDYKPGLYVGNRPMHIMKTELVGIVPGTIVAALFAGLLSLALARGDLVLYAPQANAFAAFAQIMLGGQTPWSLLIVGFIIGVFMELLTGMGTAFGLGMYLPMVVTLPMVVGGGLRDYWESRFLDVAVEQEGLSEKQRTMRLLNTYMIATGCIVGEALLGTLLAIYYVLPLLTG